MEPRIGRRSLSRKAGLLLMAMSAAPARGEVIVFQVPAGPAGWAWTTLTLGAVCILFAIQFWLVRRILGSKKKELEPEVRRQFEKTYAEKLREEYARKSAELQKQMQDTRVRYSFILTKIKNLSATLDPAKLFKSMTDLLAEDLGIAKYILFLFDREKQELYPYRWNGYPDSVREELLIPLGVEHFLTYAFQRRRLVYRLAALEDVETRPLVDRPPLPGTLVALPLTNQDELYGVIHIESFADGRTEVDDADLRLFTATGNFMGQAMANSSVFLQTKEELTSTKQLSERQIAEKRQLKEIFSRYTSSELVETILKNPGSVQLGGTTKTATILFSDIAGFTKFSAALTPAEVVTTMNEYLSKMAEIVLDHDGEIDKFIGDAVMARFGVLSDLENSARSAVETALGMMSGLRELQAKWIQEGKEPFTIRIGIATGPVLAGNIGSVRRQEFTVMGTTVNLASRLESLNKELKTKILVDEETHRCLEGLCVAVPHLGVTVRGLDEPLNVYEIRGRTPTAGT
ncbi:MAG TPA: adenylate/guanylate cyclase domain-containing protein [Candidatus Ozemobacteraceae bacterium]|nr:adenylate/guanylate cyclase domain-containing protein [Candidatus Ozemobacteraceae bacterium]